MDSLHLHTNTYHMQLACGLRATQVAEHVSGAAHQGRTWAHTSHTIASHEGRPEKMSTDWGSVSGSCSFVFPV